ncbi:MAG: amidohydrolase family protein [Actinobacteria bacterium]|nr:amidohydrolase family protein [Actinomycetota bacterium]
MKLKIRFIDCNCSFGVPGIPFFRIAKNAAELVEELDFCGIDKCLVHHASMRFDSPIIGNNRVIEEIKEYRSRLLPTWAILPSQTGEQPEAKIFIKKMIKNDIKILWSFPNEHRYNLDENTFGDLLQLLTKRHIPLFVKDNLLSIGKLLASFPKLIVIAVNQGPHNVDRYLFPLIEKYPNLYIETSSYIGADAIENFCAKYGPNKLLFGTGFPNNCSGGSILQLIQANISHSYKEAIAHGNIERLLKEVKL